MNRKAFGWQNAPWKIATSSVRKAVGVGSPLRRMIERDMLQSVLFTDLRNRQDNLATVIANVTGNQFVSINAFLPVPELRKLIQAQELQPVVWQNHRSSTKFMLQQSNKIYPALCWERNYRSHWCYYWKSFLWNKFSLLSRMKVIRLESLLQSIWSKSFCVLSKMLTVVLAVVLLWTWCITNLSRF